MALHFQPLTVKDIKKETQDCVSISFEVSKELQKEFDFKQGQSLTLRKILEGEEVRRSYSICTSPLDNELRVAVKKVPGGLFSTFANTQLKPGDVIDVMPPSGNFYTDLQSSNKKNYVAFAAGSGITPLLSIIKTTLLTEPYSTFTLVFGNKNHTSIIFKEELEALKDKYIQRFRLYHILSRERMDADINYGRINADKCLQLTKLIDLNSVDEFFICGPEEMIFGVSDFLEQNGIDKRKIHFELFTTPLRKTSSYKSPVASEANKETSKITVTLDGRSFDFDLDYDSNNILDAALGEGADLPYACKGGVCTTCKAKLVKGQVEMEVNYGLEPDEVEAGFILTCQSHPRSEKVMVDFDVK
ncbi:MAG: phenylacetate-CoA oxygenase/reductase subunit PaaK [Chitinophagaceae bacterium]|nr:phenylacetate-CoA oxygenase/reductase subunit PaaK [Chitinophagaceae bacterium]